METKTRETKEFITKGGTKICYKTYLTGREMNEVQKVLLKNVTVDMKGSTQNVQGFEATSITELNNKTIEMMVVSVGDIKEKVLDAILDLPNDEYTEVIETLNEITGSKKKE